MATFIPYISAMTSFVLPEPFVWIIVLPSATNEIRIFYPNKEKELKCNNGEIITIMIVDIGCKYSQIRNFLNRGCKVILVPYDYNFLTNEYQYDVLFLSLFLFIHFYIFLINEKNVKKKKHYSSIFNNS